jgi:septal ring factor EnvC (AmiA/AmiB activator)
MLKAVITSILAVVLALPLFAQTSEELKKQQAEIQREIDELRRTLDDTRKNKKANLGQLAMVQKKLRLREQAINNINQQINNIENTIQQSSSEIERLRNELDTLKVQYEKSIIYAYKNRSNYDFLNFIFSAASFNDALKRIEYLKSYRNYREEQADNIKKTQVALQQKIASLRATREEKDKILEKQRKEKEVLVQEKREKDEIVNKIKAREKEISKELTAKQKADARLKAAIKTAIDREIKAARDKAAADAKAAAANKPAEPSGAKTTAPKKASSSVFESTPEGLALSGNFEKNKGKLPWPIEKGHVKIHFGTYSIPNTNLKGNNPGLTLETEPGAVVRAVYEGEVSRIFDIEGNWTVLVRHGKYFTVYSNLSAVSVQKGQQIATGQMVGRAAANQDGNGEIEFLLMVENKNLDPEAWIRKK